MKHPFQVLWKTCFSVCLSRLFQSFSSNVMLILFQFIIYSFLFFTWMKFKKLIINYNSRWFFPQRFCFLSFYILLECIIAPKHLVLRKPQYHWTTHFSKRFAFWKNLVIDAFELNKYNFRTTVLCRNLKKYEINF